MDVRGKRGARAYDGDLLLRLRDARGTGNTVSAKEVKEILTETRNDMKDAFYCERSTRGLTKMGEAVTNTLQDAIKDGWIRGAGAKAEVEAFLKGAGDDHGSLDHTVHFIKDTVSEYRRNNPVRSRRSYAS